MTRYYLAYQPKNGHRTNFTWFDSLSLRTLFILDHALTIDVVSVWEGAA